MNTDSNYIFEFKWKLLFHITGHIENSYYKFNKIAYNIDFLENKK